MRRLWCGLGVLLVVVSAWVAAPTGLAGAQPSSAGLSASDVERFHLEVATKPSPLSRAERLHVVGLRSRVGLRTDAAYLKRLHSYPERFHAVWITTGQTGTVLVTPSELVALGVPIEPFDSTPELDALAARVNELLGAADVNTFGISTDVANNQVVVMVGSRAKARRALQGAVPADAITYDVIPEPVPGPDDGNRRFGPAQWFSGVRTDGRRGLVVSFVGGPPVTNPEDPCQVDYRAFAIEHSGIVRVEVRAKRRFVGSKPGEPVFCNLKGYGRTARIQLTRRLGNRPVVDAATNEAVPVFDGATLLRPTWLPPGWKLRGEGGDNNETFGPSWSRAFGIARGDDTMCSSVPTSVLLGQGSLNPPPPPIIDPYTIVDTVTVRRHPAERGIDARTGSTTIRWLEPTGEVALVSYPPCTGVPSLDLDTMTRIAQGLR